MQELSQNTAEFWSNEIQEKTVQASKLSIENKKLRGELEKAKYDLTTNTIDTKEENSKIEGFKMVIPAMIEKLEPYIDIASINQVRSILEDALRKLNR